MRRAWIAPAAFAAMLAAFYWPEISGRTRLYAADEIANDWGAAREFAEGVFRGELRLWSDRYFAGYPLGAFLRMNPLYPAKLPFFGVFDVAAATERSLFLHLLLMALFAYAYLQELGASRPAGILAGAVYSLNGFTADYYHALHGVSTFVWLPATLLAAERWLRTGERRALAGLSLATGLHWLGGHAQYAYYTGLLLPFYVAVRAREASPGRRLARSAAALGAACAGVALAAPQILLAADLRAQSARALLGYADAVAGGGNNLGAKELLEYLLPLARGGHHAPRFAPGYFGFLALLFALYAALPPRGRLAPLWTGVVAAFLALAAGRNAPAFGFLYALPIPGFSSFHDPQRAQLPAILGIGVLAGLGLDRFLAGAARGRRAAIAGAALGAGLLLGAMLLFQTLGAAEIADGWSPARLRAESLFHLALFAASALAVALAGWAVHVRPRLAGAAGGALAALAFGSLWLVNRPLLPAAPREAAAAPPLAAEVAEALGDGGRYFGEGADAWANNKGAAFGLAHLSGEDSLVPLRLLQLTRLREEVAPSYQNAYGDVLASPAALRALDVRVVLVQRAPERERVYQNPDTGETLFWDEPRFAAARPFYEPFAEAGSLRAYRLRDPLPSARCVPEAREATLAETLAALRDPAFDPAGAALLDPGSLGAPMRGAPCSARVRSNGHGVWEAEARAEGEALLVLSDAMLPGLRAAFADGRPAPLLRAYGHLRALRIPAGESRVRIVYDPPSFRLGWFAATLAGTVMLALYASGRRRGPAGPRAAAGPPRSAPGS